MKMLSFSRKRVTVLSLPCGGDHVFMIG